MFPALPCDQRSVAGGSDGPAYQACNRTPSAASIQRSLTPGGGVPGTSRSGKNTSESSTHPSQPASATSASRRHVIRVEWHARAGPCQRHVATHPRRRGGPDVALSAASGGLRRVRSGCTRGPEMSVVTIDEDGALLLIGVNRPEANNLWNLEVIQAVSRAYRRLADDGRLRVGIVYGHGRHFTAGLDLVSVAPLFAQGEASAIFPEDGCDPWDLFGEPCPKPIVVAAHGTCNTLGIELMLASQVA